MKFTNLTDRVGGKGSDAWAIHYSAIERKRNGEEIIVLSIGQEMLEPTPQIIIDSAFTSLKNARHHYSEIGGEPELTRVIAERYSKAFGIPISQSNCAVFAGAQNALFATSLCTLEPGDEAIVIEPHYATYPATFSAGGARVVPVTTLPERDFMPTTQDVLLKITDRTRAIVINSPHNPSGVVYDAEFMETMIDVCKRNDIWLISDEVYASLVAPGTFRHPASMPDAFDNCITISSVSKSHRMTGWRIGWVIAQQPLIERLFNLSMCMSYGLPMFIQDAAVTAIRNTDEISARVRNDIDCKRQKVISMLNEIDGMVIRGSKVGMFVTFDVRNWGLTATEFAWRLLDEYQVAVLPCRAFGKSGEGILRMNIGESESNLKSACECIGALASSL